MPQTKTEIRALLNSLGIAPLKRFGQHFLIDGNLMRKLVDAAAPTDRDVVLEVGPGTGSLTELLLEAAGHVISVEIDKGLAGLCRDRLGANPRFTLIHRDALETKSRIAPEIIEALIARQAELGGRMMLVANLPYQAATPLVIDLLLGEVPVSPLCFTVQAEVADRLMAQAADQAFGPVSVLVQALARPVRIAEVPPGAFWPVPKVDSAMLQLDLREDRPPPALCERLARVLHACFTHRRKTMRWSLRHQFDEPTAENLLAAVGIRPEERPERVPVEQWLDLAGRIP